MTRVVIDTNVFVSSFFGGNPREVINLWKEGKIVLCLTKAIVQEYIRPSHAWGSSKRRSWKSFLASSPEDSTPSSQPLLPLCG